MGRKGEQTRGAELEVEEPHELSLNSVRTETGMSVVCKCGHTYIHHTHAYTYIHIHTQTHTTHAYTLCTCNTHNIHHTCIYHTPACVHTHTHMYTHIYHIHTQSPALCRDTLKLRSMFSSFFIPSYCHPIQDTGEGTN